MATCNCSTQTPSFDGEKYRQLFLTMSATLICIVELAERVSHRDEISLVLIDTLELLTDRCQSQINDLGVNHGYS